jgi:hypothetical protein
MGKRKILPIDADVKVEHSVYVEHVELAVLKVLKSGLRGEAITTEVVRQQMASFFSGYGWGYWRMTPEELGMALNGGLVGRSKAIAARMWEEARQAREAEVAS